MTNWTKKELDKFIDDLSNPTEPLDGSEAMDVAADLISYEDGLETAIKKHYGVSDAVGFLADQMI